jgi:hypothetical protein
MSVGLSSATRGHRRLAGRRRVPGCRAFTAASAGWALLLGSILGKPLYVSHDSVSNYAHVWYISERLWHDHVLPMRMPVIGHGHAFAFPYAFVPWLTAAVLRPALGDWVVTLWLVLGALATIAATFWAFPELTRGWWGAAVLVNPALVMAALSGQLPFLWGMAPLLAAIGAWRRGHPWPATACAAVAMLTHPAVVGPIAMILVAAWLPFEHDRKRLVLQFAIAGVIAAPAAVLVAVSPVFSDSSTGVVVEQFIRTVGVRLTVVAVPIALVVLRRQSTGGLAPTAFVALLLVNPLLAGPDTNYAWGAPLRTPDPATSAFIRSAAFAPGATYRVLGYSDGKVSMYRLIQHGARLDAELFPESINRRSWNDIADYTQFLQGRDVHHVMVWRSYDHRYHTNEHALLDVLAAEGADACPPARIRVGRVVQRAAYDVYSVVGCDHE